MIHIVLVSHSKTLASGALDLIEGMVPDTTNVTISLASGTDEGTLGTSPTRVMAALQSLEASHTYVFYDIGSARMSSEMALDLMDHPHNMTLCDVAFIEGAFTTAVMANAQMPHDQIMEELKQLKKP